MFFIALKNKHLLFRLTINGVIKSGDSFPEKLNVLPLESVPSLLQVINTNQSIIDDFSVSYEYFNIYFYNLIVNALHFSELPF